MKRITIFAHFDKQNIIDDYVIDYLKELRKYSEIIFVSDGDLKEIETEKIKDLCFDYICKKHEEYDFGSYKRGFKLIKSKYSKKLQEIDELLFVNDSCYLIGSFGNIFADMEKKLDCDYWGLTDHDNGNIQEYHIQSYFLVFRKRVFLDMAFENFMCRVKKLQSKDEILCYYEIGLSKLLIKQQNKYFCVFTKNLIDDFLTKNRQEIEKELKVLFQKSTNLSASSVKKYLNSVFSLEGSNYVYKDKFLVYFKMGLPILKRTILNNDNYCNEKLLFLWQEIITEIYPNSAKQIFNYANRLDLRLKNRKHIKNNLIIFLRFCHSYKFFYAKNSFKKGKRVRIIKLLFFKIKYSRN